MPELTAPIVYKNDEKRIVFGPVLIPDEPDTDGDVVSAEHIEKVAHKFVEEYGNIDLQHSLNNVGKLVESYILPMDMDAGDGKIIPKGSWMMGVRVTDDDVWEAVKDGRLGGFSIMALQKAAMKSAEEPKRVTLADLGDDWIVNAVSLVDEPAVPKAKWLAIKSKGGGSKVNEETVQKAIAGSLEHRKELVDAELNKQFSGYDKFPIIHSTMTDAVVFRVVDDMEGTRKTYQVGYELGEDGKVSFTGEPQEVLIQENVVEVQNMFGAKSQTQEPPVEDEQEEAPVEKSLMRKFIEGLGFKNKPEPAEKAGMTISKANLEKLRKAKEVIDELLEIGEQEREEKSKKEGTKSMEKEEVQELINESIKPMEDKLDEVIKSLGSSQEEGVEEEQGTEGTVEKSADTEQEDEYKEKYEDVLKQLEALKSKPFSNRLAGQDGAAEKSAEDEEDTQRNAFGYKVRK